MKKIVLSLLAILALSSYSPAHAGKGAAWGAGLSGFALGSILASRPREVVYRESPQRGSYDREVRYTRRGRAYVWDEFGNKIFLERN